MRFALAIFIGLLTIISSVHSQENTVALIVGGFWVDNKPNRVLESVELFGCSSAKGQSAEIDSIEVQSHPGQVYLSAGQWFQESDSVLLCGGYRCEANDQQCGISEHCETWSPQSGWTYHSNLTRPRWGQIMVQTNNLNKTDNDEVPLVIGLNRETEIYDPDSNSWETYLDLDEAYWYSLGCFFEKDGIVWGIRNRLFSLNLNTWKTIDYGEVPGVHKNPGKCAPVEINGQMGIMTRFGFWFNTETKTWHQKAYPPTNLNKAPANAMFSFRNRPTIFGNLLCDGNGENCENTQVVQYEPDTDRWVTLGEFLHPRLFHEVIEVPASVCDQVPSHGPFEDTAAIILGGYSRYTEQPVLNSVELFGCPGTEKDSVLIANYPSATYLSAGSFVHTSDGKGRVLSCGGYSCDETGKECSVSNKCFNWDPESNTWSDDSSLPRMKWAHLFAFGPNLDKTGPDGPIEPILMGLTKFTEIYDSSSKTWSDYREIEVTGLYSIGCLTQYKGKVYVIRENLYILDLHTWVMVDMGEVPDVHKMPGRCAVINIDNEDGIMTRYGYWYNLNKDRWERKRSPPFPQPDIAPSPNSLHSFRGKATIFGVPVCDGNASICEFTTVIQYDPATNEWIKLGNLIQPRAFHDVIEIPRSMCDYIIQTTTTTTTTSTTSTTTYTTTSSTTSNQTTTFKTTTITTSASSEPLKSLFVLTLVSFMSLFQSLH